MRVQTLRGIALLVLAVAAVAVGGQMEDGCPPEAIAYDSTIVQTPHGNFEVEVCISSDSDQIVYRFVVSNIDSCPLDRFLLDPFADEEDVFLEPSGQWQPRFGGRGWIWQGPFYAPIRPGETRDFTIRVEGSAVAESVAGEAGFLESLDCGDVEWGFLLLAQGEPFGGDPVIESEKITGKYLLLFNDHDCNQPGTAPGERSCFSTVYQRIHIMQSDDGAVWEEIPGFEPFPGDVPTAVRRGNTLYVFFARQYVGYSEFQVRKYSFNTGEWEGPESVSFSDGRPPFFEGTGIESVCEPSAYIDETGRIILFYRVYHNEGRGTDAFVQYIRSATEVDGSEGTAFSVDTGERFVITTGGRPGQFEDCANPILFRDEEGYVVYFYTDVGGLAVRSQELRGSYSPIESLLDGLIFKQPLEHPAGYFSDERSEYWTYALAETNDMDALYRAVHTTLSEVLLEHRFELILETEDIPGANAAYLRAGGAGLNHSRIIYIGP